MMKDDKYGGAGRHPVAASLTVKLVAILPRSRTLPSTHAPKPVNAWPW